MIEKPIFVTQPYLPPLTEFIPYLEKIWESKILTNCGPFHEEFEAALCSYLGVNYLSLCSNGTLGLVTALQALHVTGEVITTPYSFVATANSILWNGLKPVFVDIDPLTLNIDPNQIEPSITEKTTAILAVHCYGNPCRVDVIHEIATKHNLKVIYDAAHAFGVKDEGGSILRHGHLSVISFHATKVFNTFEGGAIICGDLETKQHIDQLKNFGFVNETTVVASGINGKMSELNSALGLLQLKHIHKALDRRREIDATYRRLLGEVAGIRCVAQQTGVTPNFSYFPIMICAAFGLTRDELYQKLKLEGIYARRYFYPLITSFPIYHRFASSSSKNLLVAHDTAERILCLPIYPSLTNVELERIVNVITV